MACLLASSAENEGRLAFACAMAFAAISAYWDALQEGAATRWAICDLPEDVTLVRLSEPAGALAHSVGAAAAALDVMEAGYLIGVLCTALMPRKVRADFGALRAVPRYGGRRGVDWRSARVLAPACGAGKQALTELAAGAGFPPKHIVFATAYLGRSDAAFKKTVAAFAWGSFVWFASQPDHVIRR